MNSALFFCKGKSVMSDRIFPNSQCKPWRENPLRTKADVMSALKALVDPVEHYRSPGGARIRLGTSAAHFDQNAADMEGFSRLLWGLVPAQLGGADWINWDVIRRGLAHGCDPLHFEYWGDIADYDQRLVELAAIGFALRMLPNKLWDPLSPRCKQNVAAFLKAGHERKFADNNWQFFRLLISMGLRHVGVSVNADLDSDAKAAIERYYLDDGWYRDGDTTRADHYVPFAFHYYGLILASFDGGAWTTRYLDRASAITNDIAQWFASDGAAICFGRSMTYRFAIAGFWAGLAVAHNQRNDWGVIKGYYLRHLRWWSQQSFVGRDGILDIGYCYSNLMMSEPYNSPQSPYWALKAFLPLMLADDHPFWTTFEAVAPEVQKPIMQYHIGFLTSQPFGDAVALSSGQYTDPDNKFIHSGPEKYAKFAYSAHYGFSVEPDGRQFSEAILDNMIGFSVDGQSYRTRTHVLLAICADDVIYSRWQPLDDVWVETWLYWQGPYHIRSHFIQSQKKLHTKEGGFAVAHGASPQVANGIGCATVKSLTDFSTIIDLSPQAKRQGTCFIAAPNSNLIAAKTTVPQLHGTLAGGEHLLRCAALAGPKNSYSAVSSAVNGPLSRDLDDLRRSVAQHGRPVTLLRKAQDKL